MHLFRLVLLALLLAFPGCASTIHYTRPQQSGVYHVVKPGQTLWRICKTYGVNMEEVARLNRIEDPTLIEQGQRIFIPGKDKVLEVEAYKPDSQSGVYHVVKPGQTLWRICKTYGVNMEEVARLNRIEDPIFIETGQRIFIPGKDKVLEVEVYKVNINKRGLSFIWPIKGELLSGFGQRGSYLHKGIDIASTLGKEIIACEDGVVSFSGSMRGYGNLIIIKHDEEFFTVYAHNQSNLVNEMDEVKKGEVIAKVGRSGNATGPHLHFEIRRWGRPVDPLLYLPPLGVSP